MKSSRFWPGPTRRHPRTKVIMVPHRDTGFIIFLWRTSNYYFLFLKETAYSQRSDATQCWDVDFQSELIRTEQDTHTHVSTVFIDNIDAPTLLSLSLPCPSQLLLDLAYGRLWVRVPMWLMKDLLAFFFFDFVQQWF